MWSSALSIFCLKQVIKIKNNLSYLRDQSFAKILNEIHQEMTSKIEQNINDEKAKKIEEILRKIKKAVKDLENATTDSTIVNKESKELAQLIKQTFNEQLITHSTLKSPTALFYRAHKSVSSIKGTDDIFQEEFGYLIKAAAKIKGIDINIETIIGGQSQSSTQALNKLSEHMQTEILKITNEALKNQAKRINSMKISPFVEISARAGKTDIFTPNLKVQEDGSSLISEFLNTISGVNFSLKNYSSFQKDTGKGTQKKLTDINIHLGKSNPYKAITGSLSEILSDPRAQKRVYWRGMTILAGQSQDPDTASEDQVYKHFGHLRFIYQLRGAGLIDESGRHQVADFIIWNDPNSENIAVRSTASLIAQYWEEYSSTFSPISISASKFLT